MSFQSIIFASFACAFGDHTYKTIVKTNVKNLFPLIFFYEFCGFSLTFKCLIHFELIFVSSVQ